MRKVYAASRALGRGAFVEADGARCAVASRRSILRLAISACAFPPHPRGRAARGTSLAKRGWAREDASRRDGHAHALGISNWQG
ncbi:hypothetical protein [Salinarimonas ramus]|nr:hypothetical protein [Salinarimonas ramus]